MRKLLFERGQVKVLAGDNEGRAVVNEKKLFCSNCVARVLSQKRTIALSY